MTGNRCTSPRNPWWIFGSPRRGCEAHDDSNFPFLAHMTWRMPMLVGILYRHIHPMIHHGHAGHFTEELMEVYRKDNAYSAPQNPRTAPVDVVGRRWWIIHSKLRRIFQAEVYIGDRKLSDLPFGSHSTLLCESILLRAIFELHSKPCWATRWNALQIKSCDSIRHDHLFWNCFFQA